MSEKENETYLRGIVAKWGAELKAILAEEYEQADPPDEYNHDAQYHENLDNHSFDDNYETYEDGTYKG